MWEELIKMAAANGLWAVLFCVLLVYQLKESKAREAKYQSAIKSLSENLGIVRQIKDDVAEIKQKLNKPVKNLLKEGVKDEPKE
ncbi:MAG TPA: BhlA/UviB family holin-like peptide [Clostridia bacterium]